MKIALPVIVILTLASLSCRTPSAPPDNLVGEEFVAACEAVAERYEPELRQQIQEIEVIESFVFDLNADRSICFADPVNCPEELSFTFVLQGSLTAPISRKEFSEILTDAFAKSGYDLGVLNDSLTMDGLNFSFDGFRVLEPRHWRTQPHAQNP